MKAICAVVIGASVGLAGCAGSMPAPSTPTLSQDRFTENSLDAFPATVRAAFARDFPDVTVSSAQTETSASGGTVYRVAFIRDGEARIVRYTADGQVVTEPLAADDLNMERPGFPRQTSETIPPANPSP